VPRTVEWGIFLAILTAVISGVAVYVNAFAVREFGDATLFTTLKNGVAAMILTGVLVADRPARRAVRHLSGRQWLELTAIGLLGGGAAFLLFFNGLAMASAPSAAFIHKTLFLWVALMAVPLLGERIGWLQLVALAALAGSQILIAPMTGVSWGAGETLIAAATGLWAIEVIVARHLLRGVPSPIGAAGRMLIGMVVLLPIALLRGGPEEIGALTAGQWLSVVLTGALLAGYVATWYAALRRAPASVVTAILVLAAPITATLTVVGGGAPLVEEVRIGYWLVALGVAVTCWAVLRPRRLGEAAT
jgi:drug/metabolite transporter (DMT)-like permease